MTKRIGDQAETLVCDFLSLNRLTVVERNFHSRYGEIDIIATDQQLNLCFIEVKARKFNINTHYAHAVESVSRAKQNKIILTAQKYLEEFPEYEQYFCRFDVITVEYKNQQQLVQSIQTLLKDSSFQLQWIQHAYTL